MEIEHWKRTFSSLLFGHCEQIRGKANATRDLVRTTTANVSNILLLSSETFRIFSNFVRDVGNVFSHGRNLYTADVSLTLFSLRHSGNFQSLRPVAAVLGGGQQWDSHSYAIAIREKHGYCCCLVNLCEMLTRVVSFRFSPW